MKIPRVIYLIAAVLGTLIPWAFFGAFIASEGLNLTRFIEQLFANNPASGFTADILISSFVFWLWAWYDATQRDIKRWWIIIPANLLVGLSLALPLYLFMRAEE